MTPLDTNKGEPMKTLPEILDGVVDWAESGRTKLGRPDSTLTPSEAQKAIAKELMGCLPEKKEHESIEDVHAHNEIRVYNQCLDEVRARLTAFIGHKEQ